MGRARIESLDARAEEMKAMRRDALSKRRRVADSACLLFSYHVVGAKQESITRILSRRISTEKRMGGREGKKAAAIARNAEKSGSPRREYSPPSCSCDMDDTLIYLAMSL